MLHTDICIAGAGIIGLSLALELHSRGLRVAVVEAGDPMRQASVAAAGMLADNDPHNPAEIAALSHLSIALYPGFLNRLHTLSGIEVPYQTQSTLQLVEEQDVALPTDLLLSSDHDAAANPSGYRLLRERSLDPRQLAVALLAAMKNTDIHLLAHTRIISNTPENDYVVITTNAKTIQAAHLIDCTGAWASDPAYSAIPIKGQMLAVSLPATFPLQTVIRTKDIYIVPRTTGLAAGRAIIGATVEDVGFDTTVHANQIEGLRQRAIALLPQLTNASIVESWSGLRPATPDRLPILGAHPSRPHHWVGTGHYRNGILLAPATARVMAQLLLEEQPELPLEGFSPARFHPSDSSNT